MADEGQQTGFAPGKSFRCPVHDIPDCSPLLNGCSLPEHLRAAYDTGRYVGRDVALRQVEEGIAAQESCASPPNECYLGHNGCFVAESLRLVRQARQPSNPPE